MLGQYNGALASKSKAANKHEQLRYHAKKPGIAFHVIQNCCKVLLPAYSLTNKLMDHFFLVEKLMGKCEIYMKFVTMQSMF